MPFECSSKSLTKHFKGFDSRFTKLHSKVDADMLLDFDIDSRFTKLHSKLDADMLLNFAIHHRQNET
jgi:hypothetical protein